MDIGRDQQLIRVTKPKRDHNGIWIRAVVLALIALALVFGYVAWTNGTPTVSEPVNLDEATQPNSPFAPAPPSNDLAAPSPGDAAPADVGAPPNAGSTN